MIQANVLVAPTAQCEMIADHQGMIMGYANAQILGVCACEAKSLSLCHQDTD